MSSVENFSCGQTVKVLAIAAIVFIVIAFAFGLMTSLNAPPDHTRSQPESTVAAQYRAIIVSMDESGQRITDDANVWEGAYPNRGSVKCTVRRGILVEILSGIEGNDVIIRAPGGCSGWIGKIQLASFIEAE